MLILLLGWKLVHYFFTEVCRAPHPSLRMRTDEEPCSFVRVYGDGPLRPFQWKGSMPGQRIHLQDKVMGSRVSVSAWQCDVITTRGLLAGSQRTSGRSVTQLLGAHVMNANKLSMFKNIYIHSLPAKIWRCTQHRMYIRTCVNRRAHIYIYI
jgi:hypothetical protein